MNREEMIDKLVGHNINNILSDRELAELFRYGMTGYEDMSDEELKEQYEFCYEGR